jgi:hypothetical protein
VNIPFVPEELLEINSNYSVEYFENAEILIVDNWYKNFDFFYKIVSHLPLPRWKWSESGKNFVEYYDCRPTINTNFVDLEKTDSFLDHIKQLIRKNFKDNCELKLVNDILEFNFYKNIRTDVNSNLQHYPHKDWKYNCIIYFDKISSGGTAIYPNLTNLKINESENLLYDVSNLDKNIILAKPNRLVVFSGKKFHGGFIANHNDYVKNWRINQVLLFEESEK